MELAIKDFFLQIYRVNGNLQGQYSVSTGARGLNQKIHSELAYRATTFSSGVFRSEQLFIGEKFASSVFPHIL